MATNDDGRVAALANRLLSLELSEGITQENICVGQELARAHLAALAELASLRAANAELERWKREAMAVMAEVDTQAVGKLLGVPLGHPINAAIEPGIRRLLAANAELAGAAQRYLDSLKASVRPFAKSSDVRAPNVLALADQHTAAMRDLQAALATHAASAPATE